MLPGVSWLLLKLLAGADDSPRIADALEAAGALSVSLEAASAEERLQGALEPAPLWHANRVTGMFPADTALDSVLARVQHALDGRALPPWECATLEDADWARAWMAHYRPVQVAPRLWVVPSWCAPPDPRAVNVIMDPGLAFGSGTHPTTALCLGWLAGEPLEGSTLIDYGCGSGILAIAALKLGAREALGVDVDPQALSASRANAARNGVGARFRACAPAELGDDRAELVVANILAGTLIELAPELCARVRPHGRLALSGILAEQADAVAAGYAGAFALERRERDGWALLAGRRIA